MRTNAVNIVIFFIFFIMYKVFIGYFALSSINSIDIMMEAEKKCQLNIYYINGFTNRNFSENYYFNHYITENNIIKTINIPFNNNIGKKIKITSDRKRLIVKIFYIKINSFFGDYIKYSPENIVKKFKFNNNSSYKIKENYIEIQFENEDSNITLNDTIHFNNGFFSILLPIFLAAFSLLIIRSISLRNIYAIQDIANKKPSSQENIVALDGLRGFAALLVLADHTGYVYFKGLGGIGVWLFFVLSGFLLSTPFVKDPSKVSSVRYMKHYFFGE